MLKRYVAYLGFTVIVCCVLFGALPQPGYAATSLQAFSKLVVTQAGAELGSGLTSAGDLNGDGYADFLIGAPGAGVRNTGAIYVMYGQAQQYVDQSLLQPISLTGENVNNNIGKRVTLAGDLNGDGYADFIVGVPNYSTSTDRNLGAVYIVYGQANKFTTQSLGNFTKLMGTVAGGQLGYSMASAGDVNGDGYTDILIGSPYLGSYHSGITYLLYGHVGNFTQTDFTDAIQFRGEQNYDSSGYAMASAGDVNHDGYSDFLISATRNDRGGNNAGTVYLVYGQAAKLTSSSLATATQFTGEQAGDHIGTALSSAGDVNHDGYADFLIGDSSNNDAGKNSGRVYLVYGQATTVSVTSVHNVVQFSGEKDQDQAGYALASVGDVNSDGYDDFMIGAPSTNIKNPGTAYLVSGQANPFANQTLAFAQKFTGESIGNYAGYRVASAGDINHDGRNEILVSAIHSKTGAIDAGAVYVGYLPITSCDPTTSILAQYPASQWKWRKSAINKNDRILVSNTGTTVTVVNCKTNTVIQSLTINARAQRATYARIMSIRDTPMFAVVTRTPKKKHVRIFLFRQVKKGLQQTAVVRRGWWSFGKIRVKVKHYNLIGLQNTKVKRNQIAYIVTPNLGLKLQPVFPTL